MNSRQRNTRLSRLRKSPGFPPTRRPRATGSVEGTSQTTPRSEAPDSPATDTV